MPEIHEEEIDLREYINVLIKRKGVIILIFLIAVITATLVSYFAISPSAPPTYKSSIVFSVAKIDGRVVINLIESLEIMKSSILLDEAINRTGLEMSAGQLKSQIEVKNLKVTNFIEISVVDGSSEKAKKFAENITEVFINQNQGKYQEKVKIIEDRLITLEEQITEFEKNIQEIGKVKKKITTNEELSVGERQFQISLLLSLSVTERSLYSNLNNQVNSLKASLKNCEDFKIISYAQMPIASIKPNRKLNILIAGVLGLFVGIFVAFFLEFWQKGKS